MREFANSSPAERWSNWSLLGPNQGRHAPTIRLVQAVRLWPDDVTLDHEKSTTAWKKLEKRMEEHSIPIGASPTAVWSRSKRESSDIHELAPAAKELLEHERGMRVWRVTPNALRRIGFPGQPRIDWRLRVDHGANSCHVPIAVSDIAVWACGVGIGYIAVDVELKQDRDQTSPSVADLLDALHYLRLMRENGAVIEGSVFVNPQFSTKPPPPVALGSVELGSEWMPCADRPGGYRKSFKISALFRAIFMELADMDGGSIESAALENPETLRAFVFADIKTEGVDSPHESRRDELLTQIAEMAHARREVDRAIGDAGHEVGIQHFEYSAGAHFLISHECTAFVMLDQLDTPFWTETMPDHLLHEYFSIQILTMYQRHLVDEIRRLAGKTEATPTAMDAAAADRQWEQIQLRAIDAKARGYFIEVSVRTNHARFESVLRRVLKVDRAYELAMGLVDALCETQIARVEMRSEREARRRERMWQIVAGAVILPTMALTVMNVNMPGWTTSTEGISLAAVLVWTVALMVVGLLLASALPRLWR